MRVGVAIEETWDFFHEIYADLSEHHQTSLFERPRPMQVPLLAGRVNGYWFRKHLREFVHGKDVVFFEWASELLATVSRMPKACGIITRLHRYEMYSWAERINWDAVDRLVLVSQAKLREFTAAYPQHVHKATVIPEAVSVTRFKPGNKQFNGDIGILCHLKPRKRVYELVLAFSELVQRNPHFHLHIGGARVARFGDYDDALRLLIDRLGLRDKVTFYGHVSKPEEWYRLIDVYISNGFSEGLQVSPMEAMASGCYCVSHHWDGADELLEPENLYYTNTQLNDLLLRYADQSEAQRKAITTGMRDMVCERFNVDVTKVAIRKLVEEAGTSFRA